jgi:DNA primase
MRFSQDFIERVRESINIVDIIGQYTQLRRSGTHRYVGLCPFHNEKTPSFSVSEDKQFYHCFGCKKAGNVYTFVQEIQGLTFPETVEFLAQRAGISLPIETKASAEDHQRQDQRREREKLLFRINQFATQFFQKQLEKAGPQSKVAQYLKERGLQPETVHHFQLGYAADDWENFVRACARQQVPLAAAETLGLIRGRGEEKSGHYDIFRDRLMFPILSSTGQVLGFGGRVLGDGQPKYLNSPESEIFHKGRVFYGLGETAKHIRVEDRVIVVEGYMDFLALYQAGLKPVVATLGTALTQDHARVLKRHTKRVIVLFDGDEAGQEAAERSLPILLHEGLIPHALILPNQLDPDDFVTQRGMKELEELLKSAPELFLLVLERHLKGYRGTSAEKVALVDQMVPHLKACSDRRLKDLYIQEVAERLGVEAAWVTSALEGAKGSHEPNRFVNVSENKGQERTPGFGSGVPAEPGPKIRVVKAPPAELFLLNVALMKEKCFQLVMANGVVELLAHEGIREVFLRAIQLYGQMPNKFDSLTALLVSEVDPPETVSLHLQAPLADLSEEGAEKLLNDCSRKIREKALRSQSKKLRSNLRGQDPQEQREKLEQIMNIHRSRHSLNKES